VTIVVGGVAAAGAGIDAEHVVDVSVAIIVAPVGFASAARFTWIPPHVRGKVLVGRAHAGVDDGNNDVRSRVAHIPALRGVDVGIGHTVGLAGVVQSIEAPVEIVGVVRVDGDPPQVVAVDLGDEAAGAVGRESLFQVGAGRQFDDFQVVKGGVALGRPRTHRGVQLPQSAARAAERPGRRCRINRSVRWAKAARLASSGGVGAVWANSGGTREPRATRTVRRAAKPWKRRMGGDFRASEEVRLATRTEVGPIEGRMPRWFQSPWRTKSVVRTLTCLAVGLWAGCRAGKAPTANPGTAPVATTSAGSKPAPEPTPAPAPGGGRGHRGQTASPSTGRRILGRDHAGRRKAPAAPGSARASGRVGKRCGCDSGGWRTVPVFSSGGVRWSGSRLRRPASARGRDAAIEGGGAPTSGGVFPR
jgi:hypothetical protein